MVVFGGSQRTKIAVILQLDNAVPQISGYDEMGAVAMAARMAPLCGYDESGLGEGKLELASEHLLQGVDDSGTLSKAEAQQVAKMYLNAVSAAAFLSVAH